MRWGVPGLMVAAGIPMTVVGALASRRLNAERVRLMAAPVVSKTTAGLTVLGAF